MTALRILNVIVWGAMSVFMLSGAWAAVTGRGVRRGDPMRLACFVTGLLLMGFSLRWLIVPDDIWIWEALYTLSITDALYIIALGYVYGRGPMV